MSNYLVTNKPIPVRTNINKVQRAGDLKETAAEVNGRAGIKMRHLMDGKSSRVSSSESLPASFAPPEVGFLTGLIFPKGRVSRPSSP
jgi:hypothetical protein